MKRFHLDRFAKGETLHHTETKTDEKNEQDRPCCFLCHFLVLWVSGQWLACEGPAVAREEPGLR
jgi:hypothetical protein